MTTITPPKRAAEARSGEDAALVADRALSWIDLHLAAFDPLKGKPEPDPILEVRVGELALVCVVMSRHPRYRRDARLGRFLERLRQLADEPMLRARFVRRSAGLAPWVLLFGALKECGALGRRADDAGLIQRVLDAGNASSMRLPLHEMLALRHFLELGGFSHAIPSERELARISLLAKPVNPLYLSDADVYVITHLVFWLSDLGARPVSALSASRLRCTASTLEQLLAMYVHLGDWDLTGELLLACRCITANDSSFFDVGWRRLAAAQEPDGAVPRRQGESRRSSSAVGRRLHPTLVAAFAGIVCSPGSPRPKPG